jgi:hypothetical protein
MKWLQAMIGNQDEHGQVIGAVWGKMGDNGFVLDDKGKLLDSANGMARQFAEDLELYRGISGVETVFDFWGTGDSWTALFLSTDLR